MKKEITTKDLMALNEMMTFENWIATKMKFLSEQSTSKAHKTMFLDMAKAHYNHHEKLLEYLKANATTGGKK